jgi:uncharacterized protein (DUF924 family)
MRQLLLTLTPSEILEYWYDMKKYWFNSYPALDREIRDRYEKVWEAAKKGELSDWQNSPEGCLALVIVLDQFPLNMYRGEAKSFSTESLAIEIARYAIKRGFDKEINQSRLSFLYMPFMHSENLDDQNLSVKLFTEAGLESNIEFAKHHREIIRRFGRFPHRNKALGRMSTPDEIAYLNSEEGFKG